MNTGSIDQQVLLDRIGLVRPVENKEMHGHLYGMLKGMKDDATCNVWQKKYQTTAIVPLSPGKSAKQPGCETLRLQIGMSHHKPYFKVDFNPANLSAEEWTRLYTELGCLLDHGYASLLAEAHVSYLEIAIDCTGIPIKGLLPFDALLRDSCWIPSYDAPTPTAYNGRRGSNRVIRVYDRIARLQAVNKAVPAGPLVRIEAALRKLGCGVSALQDIKNPFKTFGICRMADALSYSHEPTWQQFLSHARSLGSAQALQLAGPLRKPFIGKLKACTCSWWNPEKAWSKYPGALTALNATS